MKLPKLSKLQITILSILTAAFVIHFGLVLGALGIVCGNQAESTLRVESELSQTVVKYSSYLRTVSASKYSESNSSILTRSGEFMSDRIDESGLLESGGYLGLIESLDKVNTSEYSYDIYSVSRDEFLIGDDRMEGLTSGSDELSDALRSRSRDIRTVSVAKGGMHLAVTVGGLSSPDLRLVSIVDMNMSESDTLSDDIKRAMGDYTDSRVVVFDRDGLVKASSDEAIGQIGSSEHMDVFETFRDKPDSPVSFSMNTNGVVRQYLGIAKSLEGDIILTFKSKSDIRGDFLRLSAISGGILLANLMIAWFLIVALTNAYSNYRSELEETDRIRVKGILISAIVSLTMLFLNSVITTEIFKARSIGELHRNMEHEAITFQSNIEMSQRKIENFIDSNMNISVKSSDHILNAIKLNLRRFESGAADSSGDRASALSYVNSLGDDDLRIFAINMYDLLNDAKYKHIRDEFSNDSTIRNIESSVLGSRGGTAVKQTSFFYNPNLNIIVVSERMLEDDYISFQKIYMNLVNSAVSVNRQIIGNIYIVGSDGNVEFDNQGKMTDNHFSLLDMGTGNSSLEILERNRDGFYEFTLNVDGKSVRMVLYNRFIDDQDKYVVNVSELKEYSGINENFRRAMMALILGTLSFAVLALLYVETRYTMKLLD